MRRTSLFAFVLGALASCTLDRGIPNARLLCAADDSCPKNHTCIAYLGEMVCCKNGDCGPSIGGPETDAGPELDGTIGDPDATSLPPADAGALPPMVDSGSAPRDSRPVDGPPRPPADAARDLAAPDMGPPRIACMAGACTGAANCVNGFCEPAPASCGALKQQLPTATDGVYWIQLAGRAQRAYCDMMTGTVLCAARGMRTGGRTREGSGQRFSLWSELQPGEEQCKIWAVRHEDSYPMDKLFATTPPLPVSTCQAFGFKGGDEGLSMVCRYGWDNANGYTDCGFKVSPIFKWGNSCDCSLVNGQRPRRYVREEGIDPGGRGLFEGGIPWNESGTIFGLCRVR